MPSTRRSGPDSVRQYLAEMGRTPLLERAEEIALAKAIEAGKEATQRLDTPGLELSPEEARRLRKLVREGEAAMDRMILANLRLVVSIARRYRRVGGLDLLELIQEGNIGLMTAIERFDWRKGFKLSTYASWWIKQAITRAIHDKARTIRLPVHTGEKVMVVERVRAQLTSELSREPTLNELAKAVGVKPEYLQDLLGRTQQTVSLDAPATSSDENATALGDMIAGVIHHELENAADGITNAALVAKYLEILPIREREVLELRFGLADGTPWTLEEIGGRYSLTRERIRQIETKALLRIRNRMNVGV